MRAAFCYARRMRFALILTPDLQPLMPTARPVLEFLRYVRITECNNSPLAAVAHFSETLGK